MPASKLAPWFILVAALGCGGGGASPTDALPPLPDAAGPPPLVNPSRYNTVLGRPTDHSIAVSVLAAAAGDEISIEYGTQLEPDGTTLRDGVRSGRARSAGGEPMVVELAGLTGDTAYYYRVHYHAGGQGDDADNLHTFHTQRAPGASFHFGVQGDSHPERWNNKMFHADLYTLTMAQVRDRQPDLHFMLGDDFSIEKVIQDFKTANYGATHVFHRAVEGVAPPSAYALLTRPFAMAMIVDGTGAPRGNAAYLEQRERYLGLMANATPLMLVNGNHEQAHAANLGGVFNTAAVWAADARLKYYPLPAPDGFYDGDATRLTARNGYPTIAAADGLLRDYYAFTWGDALFVVIDPYWHSEQQSPDSSLFDGDPEDPWLTTMGDAQYQWLAHTLATSTARWKFVFAHHINGNNRGGASSVGNNEWGGPVAEFAARRPTWAKPIHQLLVDNHVTIFFQGHDHLFARETIDGVIYQEVPNPADNSYFPYNCDAYAPTAITWAGPAGYGHYDPSTAVRLPNSGFLDVTVGPDGVRVDYVRTYRAIDLSTNPNGAFRGTEQNGEVAFSYSVPAQPTDTRPGDVPFTCTGDAPPAGWVYNP